MGYFLRQQISTIHMTATQEHSMIDTQRLPETPSPTTPPECLDIPECLDLIDDMLHCEFPNNAAIMTALAEQDALQVPERASELMGLRHRVWNLLRESLSAVEGKHAAEPAGPSGAFPAQQDDKLGQKAA
jgi:hypothetical protein